MKIFIIEHLEPELGEWTLIEYAHISRIIGKDNLWFTNIANNKDKKALESYGKVINESVKSLKLNNSCILDPESPEELTPDKAGNLDYFIFGGILGDYPPKKRTSIELSSHLKTKSCNIGKIQMSTDNAVFVVKKITEGTPLEKIPFKDNIEIKINKIESTILPYRYALINGRPLISQSLIKYLKTH